MLAGRHGRLPGSLVIADQVEVSEKIIASGGFADVKCGVCRNHLVAVKVLRTPSGGDMEKVHKVSHFLPFEADIKPFAPAVLQGGCSLGFVVPPKYPEAPRRPGRFQFLPFFRSHGTDGTWKRHAVYQNESHQ